MDYFWIPLIIIVISTLGYSAYSVWSWSRTKTAQAESSEKLSKSINEVTTKLTSIDERLAVIEKSLTELP